MTAEKEYLLELLSCHLNGDAPQGREVNWANIFNLADIHDIGAVVASEIRLLPKEAQPVGKVASAFRQLIGQAIQHDAMRTNAFQAISTLLNEQHMAFLPVKGILLKDLYPAPALRLSGDIDILIQQKSYEELCNLLQQAEITERFGITDFYTKGVTAYCKIDGFLVEIHANTDVNNDYFGDIFERAEKTEGCEYRLTPYDHLLYVFLHLVKHISADRGAGLRMLMDMDVAVRAVPDFDESRFYSMCEKAGQLNYAKIILSVISKAFKTPVSDTFGINSDKEFYQKFMNTVIDGGCFGYIVQSKGFYHYYAHNNTERKVTKWTKLKAMLRYIFPPASYVRTYRAYSERHAILIPLAYLARAKDAFFKRRKLALSTFKEINSVSDKDIKERQFLETIDTDNQNRSEL